MNEQVEFGMQKGETVELDCTAAGAPNTWSKGLDSMNREDLSWDSSVVTVEFSEPQEYSCTASNAHGSINRVFTLTEAGNEISHSNLVARCSLLFPSGAGHYKSRTLDWTMDWTVD